MRFLLYSFALLLFPLLSQAYNEYSHEWITRSALDYLRDHPHAYPETDSWVEKLGPARGFAEEALVRAVVDTDYRTDVWLGAWLHAPFTGADVDGDLDLFTTLFHYVNVTTPGKYWNYDGFSYRKSTQQGNDTYLNYLSVSVEGNASSPLGGETPLSEVDHGADLGVYNQGFKGNKDTWKELFSENSGSEVVFPPSTVPAQAAYNLMLQSPRAAMDSSDLWTQAIPLVTGFLSTENLERKYWRGEVEGLPRNWDLLGMTLHLSQDATVPQHVEGTSDNCHPEYEAMLDQLTCSSATPVDRSPYYDGSYSGAHPGCGVLYDPELVSGILKNKYSAMSALAGTSVAARIINIALRTAKWTWQTHNGIRSTTLPDGTTYQGNQCSDLFSIQAVMRQAKLQYNLAIAETVALFEAAAHDYELAHAFDPPAALAQIANWFANP